ncbi:H(+)/Cl(-) exchange transporter ClcA [Paraburkholderia sp. UYCP14C]|nr:H(+)/Cl(-) exchange transporter ClcA [Paraburkholderia sp. UYCP14C]
MSGEQSEEKLNGLCALSVVSLITGMACGALGALFRLCLEQADRLRNLFLAWAHTQHAAGIVFVVVGASAATALAAWLVRRFAPDAGGSGIPHVEAVLNRELPAGALILVPVKFIGGVLAIGAGLALGREGPTVQMGASIAHWLGVRFRRNESDCAVLFAAGAGAGLATAFNAPIAGSVFVLEELMRRFETRVAAAALGASAGAIAIARVIHGDAPDFKLASLAYPAFGTVPAHLILGLVVGIVGVAYCKAILWALAASDRLARWPVEAVAAIVGGVIGLLAWYQPDLVGGGDPITQRALTGVGTISAIAPVFLVRFALGPISYAAGTPGGLFAPMLVLGAQLGLVFGIVVGHVLPALPIDPVTFAVVAMAGFFAAVVRAPVTGIVMVTEMTGSFTLLLPMLTTCFVAMIVPMMLGCAPIYDSLGARSRRQHARNRRNGSR